MLIATVELVSYKFEVENLCKCCGWRPEADLQPEMRMFLFFWEKCSSWAGGVRKENASNGLPLITTFIPTPPFHRCIHDRYFRHLCAEISPHLNDDLSWKWIYIMH